MTPKKSQKKLEFFIVGHFDCRAKDLHQFGSFYVPKKFMLPNLPIFKGPIFILDILSIQQLPRVLVFLTDIPIYGAFYHHQLLNFADIQQLSYQKKGMIAQDFTAFFSFKISFILFFYYLQQLLKLRRS